MKELKLKITLDSEETEIRLDKIIEKLVRIVELKKELAELEKPTTSFQWYPSDGITIYTSKSVH